MHTQESQRASRELQSRKPSGGGLRVVCFSTYVADPARQTPRHRDVRNFLLALRGERIVGESKIPVGKEERSLTTNNVNDSIDWFGEMAAEYVRANDLPATFALIPVPTAKATLESSSAPWTSLLAISIVSNGLPEADVADVLRWREPLPPPGERALSAAELYANLAVTRKLAPGVSAVLVDYLYTSSATVRACAARLQDQGVAVPMALCAGRTTDDATHDAFRVVVGEITPFEPGN